MFSDVGALELIALVILAVLVFGPEKLPKVIQDVSGFMRKVRSFSDNARDDIRSELGPEFKDFDFEDLNPKTFARKHLVDGEDYGLNEVRNSFDLRKDLSSLTDTVNGSESEVGTGGRISLSKEGGDGLSKPGPLAAKDPAPFDPDAT